MSSRRAALSLSASLVAGAAVCGALLVPASAAAAPKAAGLTIAVGDVVRDTVTRGQGEDSLTVTVTNTTDVPQPYDGAAVLLPTGGPSPLDVGQVRVDVQPLTAPATDSAVVGQAPGLVAEFFPHGGKAFSDHFAIPANSSYSWKVTFAFAANYPGNDDGLDVTADGSATPVHFDLSPALPDGKLTDRFDHPVTVTPGSSGQTTLETSNGAGGSFTSPLSTLVNVFPAEPDGSQSALNGLQLEVRTGNGPWQKATTMQAGNAWSLPTIPAGFAYGQERDFQLRFTLPDNAGNPKSAQDLLISATTWLGNPIASAQIQLHYQPATSASTTPTPSAPPTTAPAPAAPATPTPTTPAVSSAPTPTTSAAAPGPAPDITGQLAHTGTSHTDLYAGLAAALAAAGAALLALTTRRRRRTTT
jgi:hypothetical protein